MNASCFTVRIFACLPCAIRRPSTQRVFFAFLYTPMSVLSRQAPMLRRPAPCLNSPYFLSFPMSASRRRPDYYPQRFSKRLATRQPSTSNVKSRRPRHKVRTPGIPSLVRFRCPPRRPIHNTACPSVSGNTARPVPNLATKTAHSSSLSNTVAGASGSCRARSRNATIRAATLVYTFRPHKS